MHKIEDLTQRLNAIAASLSRRPNAQVLLGLGSSGLKSSRLDEFSDLDFFVIVAAGSKHDFLENLDWLTQIYPAAYVFQNSPDGYKLLFADDILCEFAVFEPAELAEIPMAGAKILWSRSQLPDKWLESHSVTDLPVGQSEAWLLGEALTNLYVGLQRSLRGERLSGYKFIQSYAVDRLLELASRRVAAEGEQRDPFRLARRFEKRFPAISTKLPEFMPGYAHNAAAAEAILEYLEAYWEVNAAIANSIRAKCARLRGLAA